MGATVRLVVAALVLWGGRVHADADGQRFTDTQEASLQALAGVGAAVLTIPSTMAIGHAISGSTSNLTAALVPSLLLQIAVPSVAVTLAEWAVGRYAFHNGSRFHPTIWLALGVNIVAITLGAVGGVWTENHTSYALFTITESLVLPAATTALMYSLRKKPRTEPPPPRDHAQALQLLQVTF